MTPKPLLFITGFLGAGKTTLLRALLDELRKSDKAADVILNDFENAEIDASTLHDRAASIYPIAASCACCDSLDDLVQLCLATQNGKSDVLLIELNGTADPLPLLETFTLVEEKLPFLPRWQVGVVDARHWGRRDTFAPLEQRQIETASHWILTHTEELTDTEIDSLCKSVSRMNPYAKKLDASQLASDLISARNAPEVSSANHAIKETSRRGHSLSHRLTGYQISLPGRHQRDNVMKLLEALPADVVRAKALVDIEGAPGSRWLFQRTGRDPVDTPLEIDGLSRTPASLVCIGPCLAPEALRAQVTSHLEC
jgi:G3E family GTPase